MKIKKNSVGRPKKDQKDHAATIIVSLPQDLKIKVQAHKLGTSRLIQDLLKSYFNNKKG